MSDKIKPHHLGRKAILYVRQSSAHQVMHNQESRILQYAMRDRLRELGGRRMTVYYTGCNHDVPRYACRRGSLDNGEPRCIAFGGRSADEAIEGELLRVLEPAAIEAALEAHRSRERA
jgi:hypothetical protein